MISLNEFYRFYTNNLFNATRLSRYSNFILWTSENVKFLVIFAFWRERKAIHGKLSSSTIINNAVQTSSILTQAAIINQRSTSSKSLTNFWN